MDVKKTLPWAITDASVIVDRTGRAILHSSLRDERPGERVAIARLAAAAPDLLAACEAAADLATPGATSCEYEGEALLKEIATVLRAARDKTRGEG